LSIFTAALIEMGLLNCTNVITVMTANTTGSQWVPYEYGRLKTATLPTMNVASWWDTTTIPKEEDLPGYLHLAPILKKESAIRSWLGGEMREAQRTHYPTCPGRARSDWPQHVAKPGPLPTG